MPDRETHVAVGMLAGLGAAALAAPRGDVPQLHVVAELVGGLVGGAIGGRMPDLIEPATSPNHRQIAHSVVTGGAFALARVADLQAACRERAAFNQRVAAALGIEADERKDADLRAVLWLFLAGAILGFAAGYASHLVLDAGTPRGLPLLGR